ncbi:MULTISPECIES: hypothetical protein [Spirosoma]|uniref:Uncharacterized protein n=1 Tax=Spirosoma linguale (strain ATCC 33905 / DSM 74 / LMG 10896 / Claus 1) TaxID=504472 RepID=D2QVS8_SPILD|nr:hypothetical protein [Spirosoma sp.]ADB42910.1 hypothetical protein Slin_6966 [Spirosoma linguale DSM 74]MBR8837139.1 hypothetical protein [Stigonema ocellatum SAG 48.90 = DSM 106950]MCX6213846.1 hypothetical protein [Spirosoma sp.]
MIELRLNELQADLTNGANGLTYQLEPALSADQQKLLNQQIQAIRDLIGQLVHKYGLSARRLAWSQRLNALSSSLWVDLQDSRSDQMPGYGAFTTDEHPADNDQDIGQLIVLIRTIQT